MWSTHASSSKDSRGQGRSAVPRSPGSTAIPSSCVHAVPCSRAPSSRSTAAWRRCHRPPGDFDRRAWLARQGVHETLTARSLAVIGLRGGVQGVLDRLRRGAHAALRAGGDDESSRIAAGVALGGTAALDDRTVEEFRASGLAHLLAVSGGNVVLLVAAILALGWVAGVPRSLAHGCAIPAVVGYAAIVGGGPSVVRAAATGVLASLAWLAGSARDPWHLLALAAAAVLALDPWAVVGPGFQLSFVAVAAIHGLAPPIRGWLEGTVVPVRLCAPLAISLACTAATAPVAYVHFGRASLVAGLPANLLALPAVAPLLWLALSACAALADRARRGSRLRLAGACARRLHRADRAPRRLARRRAAGSGTAHRARGRRARLARPPAACGGPRGRARRTSARARMARRASVAAAGARAPRHVPGCGTGRRHADRGAGRARARRHRTTRGARRATAAPARRGLAGCALPLARRARPRRARGSDRAIAARGGARHARPAGAQREPRARRSRRHAREARGCCAGALGSCSAGARWSCACSARCTPRGRRRRTTPRWSSWRARGHARSCCPPTPSRRSLLTDASHRVGVLEVAHHGSATPASDGCSRRLRPAARGHLGGRPQHLRPSRPGTLAALGWAGVPVRRTDREGDIALGCRAGG